MLANGPGVRHTRAQHSPGVCNVANVWRMPSLDAGDEEMKMSLHNVTFLAAVSTRSPVPRVQV